MSSRLKFRASCIAFSYRAFVLFQSSRVLSVTALEMLSVAVGWQVYDITHNPLDLGLIGLAQFLPGVLLFLPSGFAADRFHRKRILVACYCGYALCAALLLKSTLSGASLTVLPIYATVLLLGVVRAYEGPVRQSLVPELVSEEDFPLAVFIQAVAEHSLKIQKSAHPAPLLRPGRSLLFPARSRSFAKL